MVNRVVAAAGAVLAATLVLSAPPAHAETTAPTPLTLESATFEATVSAPPPGQPLVCDGTNFVFCGFVAINVEFSGLDGRERPAPGDSPVPLSASGTVDLTRVYGCATAQGRRLHRYDTKVVERDVVVNSRRGIPYSVPAGDTLRVGIYGLLLDAQPGNCPRGTTPRLYRLVAKHAEVVLESRWAGLPASTTYAIPGQARWDGSALTPQL